MSNPIQPFSFNEQEYTTRESLVNAMGLNWNAGRALLYSGALREHFRKSDPEFANTCAAAEKEYGTKPDEGNRIYLRWLCKAPGIRALYWRGRNYGDLSRIAQTLITRDETLRKLLMHMMREQFLSIFMKNIGAEDSLVGNVRFLERTLNRNDSMFKKQNALTILECLMAGDRQFVFDGQQFADPKDLAAYLQTYADQSRCALSRRIQPLFEDEYNFEPHFEAWILIHGFQHELTLWKVRFQEGMGSAGDAPDVYLDDDQGQPLALQQSEPEFLESLDGFEDRFLELLRSYPDRLDDPIAFNGLLNDYFPTHLLQRYLLMSLYRMDIVKALRDAQEITEPLTVRFERRLIRDFGVRESFAGWAVSVWTRCYGGAILGRPGALQSSAG